MPSGKGDENIFECSGVRTQFGERDAARGERFKKSRQCVVQLGYLQLREIPDGMDCANSLQFPQRSRFKRGLALGSKFQEVLHAERGDQAARRIQRDYLAVIHDGDTIAKFFCFVHVVRGEQDCASAAFQLVDEIPKLAARLGVQAGGRLIEKEELRIAYQRAGQREALFLSAGKFSHASVSFSSSCTVASNSCTSVLLL